MLREAMMDKAAMKKGRERHLREQRREALARVAAYERWLKAGSRLREIPQIPSDADYAIARSAGRVKRGLAAS
jgi:hypothetical protein